MAKRRLNIKNLVPRKDSQYKQGYYNLVNLAKYIGDPNKIIFRSSWERKFAVYCDSNDRIVAWSSEPLQIPYMHPIEREIKPYNVDFYVKLQLGENLYRDFLVEVTPSRQLKQPIKPTGRVTEKRMTAYTEQMKAYLINVAKFNAAQQYATSKGWEFIVVTESFIF
jgi:hypothetical protein